MKPVVLERILAAIAGVVEALRRWRFARRERKRRRMLQRFQKMLEERARRAKGSKQ